MEGEGATPLEEEGQPNGGATKRSLLKPGDRLKISIQAVDNHIETGEEVDDKGEVTLLHIGDVIVAGLTTGEAEAAIRERYIEKEIFTKLTVIVVAEVERYFVRGHVKKAGEFLLTPGLTLSQALTISGFNPFGYRKKVELIRGNKMTFHNLERIEEGEEVDPPLQAGDKINVRQKPPFSPF